MLIRQMALAQSLSGLNFHTFKMESKKRFRRRMPQQEACGHGSNVSMAVAHSGPLSALRGATAPSRNNLSHANKRRDAALAEWLFWAVLDISKSFRRDLPQVVVAKDWPDVSVGSFMWWTPVRSR